MGSGKYRLSAFAIALAPLGFAAPVHAQSAQAPEFAFEGDMVLGHACVLTSQFKHFQSIVWRIRVTDPKTGKNMDDKSLKSLVVELSDGQKFPMKYKGHPAGANPPTDHFWSTSWQIPESYPTGSFSYKVVALGLDGQETDWEPFKVAASQLTIVAN